MNDKKYKIGLGIITKDTPELFTESIKTIPENVIDYLCVVNDGTPYSNHIYNESKNIIDVIQHPKNLGVACSKNSALRSLIQNDCDFLFLMNDNILIKNKNVFEKYIKAAQVSGLWHMSYAFSSLFNYNKEGFRDIKETIEYDSENSVIFVSNLVSDFEFFHKSIIKNIGYMDERYGRFNTVHDLDYCYKMVKSNLLPAYWWWPDINNSWDYISVIPNSVKSNMFEDSNFIKNLQMAFSIFENKFGFSPNNINQSVKEDVLNKINSIQNTYARSFI